MKYFFIFSLLSVMLWTGCKPDSGNHQAILPSPGFNVHLYFNLFNGNPYYLVFFNNQKIIRWSLLGFKTTGGPDYNIMKMHQGTHEIDPPPSGFEGKESVFFDDLKFNELSVHLFAAQDEEMGYAVDFRAFEGGFAFRYRMVAGEKSGALLANEVSEFNFENSNISWLHSPSTDSLARDKGRFDVPFELYSDRDLQISIFETPAGSTPGMMLQQHEHGKPAFSVSFEEGWKTTNHPMISHTTPWRVVLISNSIYDE